MFQLRNLRIKVGINPTQTHFPKGEKNMSMLGKLVPKEVLERQKIDELIQLRLHFGVTQEQLANHLGYTKTAINQWENGRTRVPTIVLMYLRLLKKDYASERQLQAEIVKIKEERGIKLGGNSPNVLASRPWEQMDLLQEITEDEIPD